MKITAWFHQDQKTGYGYMQGGVLSVKDNGGRPHSRERDDYKIFVVEFDVPDLPWLETEPIKASVKEE